MIKILNKIRRAFCTHPHLKGELFAKGRYKTTSRKAYLGKLRYSVYKQTKCVKCGKIFGRPIKVRADLTEPQCNQYLKRYE